MIKEKEITLHELLQFMRENNDREDVNCVYGNGDSLSAALESKCYLSDPPTITDDYEEVYPNFVSLKGLELWFKEELIKDVVTNALGQNPDASNELLLKAIHYYDERDSFMTI